VINIKNSVTIWDRIVCALCEYTRTVFSFMTWWWFLWTGTCRQIFNIDRYIYCCVIDWNKLLYYVIRRL